jgi:hypothetical protein
MKVNLEINLTNFEFWAGAKNHSFTYNELQEIEFQLEDIYPDGMDETQINDLFWFEEEFLCELIGLKYKKYLKR